jgi:hypothetical protein
MVRLPANLDYHWHLRMVMAESGMFAATDLIEPLEQRGITLSSSQDYRLVVERPERLSLKLLIALLDILDCMVDGLKPFQLEPTAFRSWRSVTAAGWWDLSLPLAPTDTLHVRAREGSTPWPR